MYLGLSILELSKILKCEFLYDSVKPKYSEKVKFCYMDRFIVYIKRDDIYKLQNMLKQDLILQVMNQIDYCLKEKTKK